MNLQNSYLAQMYAVFYVNNEKEPQSRNIMPSTVEGYTCRVSEIRVYWFVNSPEIFITSFYIKGIKVC